MKKLYILSWWIAVLQWPFYSAWVRLGTVFVRSDFCQNMIGCVFSNVILFFYFLYSGHFAPFTTLLTLILFYRLKKKKSIGKLETTLAIFSWGFSVYWLYVYWFGAGKYFNG